jgi:hypothetical protein
MRFLHSLFFAWVLSVKDQTALGQEVEKTRKIISATTDRRGYGSAGFLPAATTFSAVALGVVANNVAGGAAGVTRRKMRGGERP